MYDYDRGTALQEKFNKEIASLLGVPVKDYYSELTDEKMLGLKTLLADINNIMTLRLTNSLAEWVIARFGIEEKDKDIILGSIKSKKPNSNGFDLEVTLPKVDLVAEVKCTVPINGGEEFGSAQAQHIRQDIEGLIHGKKKSSKNTNDLIKLLAVYDTPNVRKAIENLKASLPENVREQVVVDPQNDISLSNKNVYVIFLK